MQGTSLEFPINIQRFLPHRKPMLMVDFVTGLDDQSITTNFQITADNIFLENGFFNETGVIENAAQTCSGIVGWPHFEENIGKEDYKVEGFISKIQTVEIFDLPPVNSNIQTKGEMLSIYQIGDLYNCKMDCKTYIGSQVIAHCVFTLMIKP